MQEVVQDIVIDREEAVEDAVQAMWAVCLPDAPATA